MSLPRIESSADVGSMVLDYLRIVYRRRWLAITVVLMVIIGVGAYTYTRVPLFQARTSILIELEQPNVVGNIQDVFKEGTTLGNYYQTQYELLRSRPLVERTVRALELWKRPNFSARSEAAAVDAVLGRLQIMPVRNTRLVNVQFRSPDPGLAAEIANEHAKQYVEQSLENRFLASKEATDWLDAQLAEERQRVQQTESALQSFREQHDAVSLEKGQNIVVQKLADLNTAVTEAKTKRIEAEAQYRQLVAAEQQSALDSFPAILSNSFIQTLKGNVATLQREYAELSETLGERHPTLIERRTALETVEKRLAAEVARVVESVRTSYRTAVAQETTLTQALDEQKREALALNRRGIEYAALEREAESVRTVYQTLLQRAKETGVSRELRSTNIRIIEPAQRPQTPVFPRPSYNMVLALLGGVILAIGAVLSLEAIDDRIKTPDDVRNQLGVAVCELVPKTRTRRRKPVSLLQRDRPAVLKEAFRRIRTSVLSATRGEEAISIVVASASEREGKTLVATNLAITLAQAQQRVLLIDADMRRPSVHNIFSHALEPGLSDVLRGTASLRDALRSTSVPGLTVLSAGKPSVKAPELLGSASFKGLFDILQQHFPWVIIDTPPLLSVTDAAILAGQSSRVLFVVSSETTKSSAARLAMESLQRAGGNVVGTVLNRADIQQHPFYFAPYSSGSYGDYLDSVDDSDDEVVEVPGGGRWRT